MLAALILRTATNKYLFYYFTCYYFVRDGKNALLHVMCTYILCMQNYTTSNSVIIYKLLTLIVVDYRECMYNLLPQLI